MPKNEKPYPRRLPEGITLLYEDRDLLVIDKPAGLLTVKTDSEKEHTAAYILSDYMRRGCAKSRNRVFVVHRLDRWTSGLLIFAKTEVAHCRLQERWPETQKKYLAVVHGLPARRSDTVRSYLAENSAQKMYSTNDPRRGKPAQTAYRVLQHARGLALLEINLLTGRKNQIRVHMADIGHPVVGDRKYGRADDGYTQLALHARSIAFHHPFDGRPLFFESPTPKFFETLVGPIVPYPSGTAEKNQKLPKHEGIHHGDTEAQRGKTETRRSVL